MATRRLKKIVYNTVIICLLVAGVGYVCSRFMHLGNVEYTDNAQIRQHITPVNTRVQGFIDRICFEEFQPVGKGDTLVVIEDAEFRLRLAQAEADLENSKAALQAAVSGLETMENDLSVNDAAIEELKVQMENAGSELARYSRLLEQDAVTGQQYDNVKTAYEAARARHEKALRTKESASLMTDGQRQKVKQAEAAVAVAESAVDLARLNLSYTVLTAAADGVAGRREINEGQLIQPGQTVVDIVDGTDIWVIANYRETQLKHIRVGADVSVKADAVPGVEYSGVVESISDATGAAFSLVPQDNATGNFVKVEQRVPVRIRLEGNPDELTSLLKAGFNVECKVRF